MGKMTDALEVLCNSYFGKTGNIAEVFQRIQDFHQQIIRDLFGSADSEVNARVEALYQELDLSLIHIFCSVNDSFRGIYRMAETGCRK